MAESAWSAVRTTVSARRSDVAVSTGDEGCSTRSDDRRRRDTRRVYGRHRTLVSTSVDTMAFR